MSAFAKLDYGSPWADEEFLYGVCWDEVYLSELCGKQVEGLSMVFTAECV